MKLAIYLEQHRKSASVFASEIGVPASTITRLLANQRSPRLDLLARIKVGTNGEVTPNDFLHEPEVHA